MRGLRKVLTPFAPDQSGAVSVLYSMGALTVVIDAGGCTGNICGFDEPRWHTARSAVFSAGLRDIDAILGRDDLLIRKLEWAVKAAQSDPASRNRIRFTALVGTPVPAVIGTDYDALARIAEKKTGLKCVPIPASGMKHYDSGAEKAWLALFQKFAAASEKTDRVGVIGYTPLDFDEQTRADFDEAFGPCTVYGLDTGVEALETAGGVRENVVIAPSGIAAAQYLERKFGTPYRVCDPFAGALLRPQTDGAKKILIVHQAVTASSLEALILARNPEAQITKASWFMTPASCGSFIALREEDDFTELVQKGGFDLIVADEVMRDLAPDCKGLWIDARHFAVSGRTEKT